MFKNHAYPFEIISLIPRLNRSMLKMLQKYPRDLYELIATEIPQQNLTIGR